MSENNRGAVPETRRPRRARGRALWMLGAALAVAVLPCCAVTGWNRYSEHRMEKAVHPFPIDPETGIMRGAEPRDLNADSAIGTVLFVHGFSGTPNNFADLPDAVAAAGWRARVILLPGHGTDPREFAVTPKDALVDAVLGELRAIAGEDGPVVLVGHSMGGALVTFAAAREPELVRGLVLAAPYYAVTRRWYYGPRPESWLRLLGPAVPWVYSPQATQPVRKRESRPHIVSYNWIPTRAMFVANSIAAEAALPGTLSRVTAPALLLHSRLDRVTSPPAAETAFGLLGSADKRAVWLANSDHIIFWDHEAAVVEREVLSFLAGLAGAGP